MKKSLLKLLVLSLLFSLSYVDQTNSYFTNRSTISGNTVSAGCWVAPEAPTLFLPVNNYLTNSQNVTFTWQQSNTTCPIAILEYNLNVDDTNMGWGPLLQYTYNNIPEGERLWKVQARDQFGNVSPFSEIRRIIVDRTPPVIDLITVGSPGENNTKVTITWRTNENATSNIDWGTTTSYGHSTSDTTADNTIHSVDLSGLSDWTLYHYHIRSQDAAGNESTTADMTFRIVDLLPSPSASSIVINEFIPDPSGADDALMPAGEWVELYNKSNSDYNVVGWRLCNSTLQCINIDNSKTNTGNTIVPAKGFLVVYQNGQYHSEWLKNSGDVVSLFAGSTLIDARWYFGPTVKEGKSIARYPDGSINWFDPIPSPGQPNMLECSAEPSVEFNYTDNNKQSVYFNVINISDYVKISYELSYNSDSGVQGIIGEQALNDQNEFSQNNLLLGTCSSGGTCIYHQGVKNIKLTINLLDKNNIIKTLTAPL